MSHISRQFDNLENYKHIEPAGLNDSMLEQSHRSDLLSRMFNIMMGNHQSKGIFQEAIQYFEVNKDLDFLNYSNSLD